MLLLLKRSPSINGTTIGSLYVDGKFICYTLEDQIRVNTEKVYSETAIPAGTYKVTVSMSNRFKKLLPELHNVPNFVGVRIHSGNTKKDTEGCILLGTMVLADKQSIINSRIAFSKVFKLIQEAIAKKENVSIEIRNP